MRIHRINFRLEGFVSELCKVCPWFYRLLPAPQGLVCRYLGQPSHYISAVVLSHFYGHGPTGKLSFVSVRNLGKSRPTLKGNGSVLLSNLATPNPSAFLIRCCGPQVGIGMHGDQVTDHPQNLRSREAGSSGWAGPGFHLGFHQRP